MASRRPRGQLRTQILDAVDRLLLQTGDANDVSIDAVVETVGCTPPALYHYFPSKDLLLAEVCRRQFARFAAELEAAIPATDDPIDELIARGHAYVGWAIDHPEHYRILFMTSVAAPAGDDEIDPSQSAGLAELIDNLERAVAAGRLELTDPLQAALALWSAVHGMASIAIVNPALPRDLAHAVIEFTARALLAALVPPRRS